MTSPLTETLEPGSPQYEHASLKVVLDWRENGDGLTGITWQIFGKDALHDPDYLQESKWLGQLGRQGWQLVQVDERVIENDDVTEKQVTTYYFMRQVR